MPDVDGISLFREWSVSVTDGCPVVICRDTAPWRPPWRRRGSVRSTSSKSRCRLRNCCAPSSGRSMPASAADSLRKALRPATPGPRRQERLLQQLRTELAADCIQSLDGSAGGRARLRTRGIARYLHGESPRANAPFVALVSSALREADAQEQLLGRERASRDCWRRPQGAPSSSTSLEDLPPAAQRVLLGVLESGSFTRLNGTRDQGVHGTHTDLGTTGRREVARAPRPPRCAVTCLRTSTR